MEEGTEQSGREYGRRSERRLLEEELFVSFHLYSFDSMFFFIVDCVGYGDGNGRLLECIQDTFRC